MRICLVRQIIEQFKDVGKYTHCGNIGPCSRPLNHKRRARITLRRESDDVVARLGRGDWMIARKFLDPSASERAFKRAYVSQYGVVRLRTLQSFRHFRIVLSQ